MGTITVGIDLGGTKILALALDESAQVVGRSKVNTRVELGMEGIGKQMHAAAGEALAAAGRDWEDVETVGIAVPTSVDPATGDALHAPALGWRNQPARSVFEGIFGRPIYLGNDANCGTLAEWRAGAAQGAKSVVGYFVGTGLGGAVIIDGRVRRGVRGVAGELGHEIVRYNGRRCGCGTRGCIEAYASKTAFCRQFDKLINGKGKKSCLSGDFTAIKSKALAKAYGSGDKVTHKVVNKGMVMLGVATANMVAVLSPDCVIYGGGVMEAMGEHLLPIVRDSVEKHLFGVTMNDVSLKLSALGDDAVPLGAAFLARSKGEI